MREIKFRGKRLDNGEWVYGYYTCNDTVHYIHVRIDFDLGFTLDEIEVIPETIGQYTGLHDKNGKEIYEGDLIHNYQTCGHPNPPGTVDFNYGCWGYDCYHASHLPLDQIASESEIIGNIHENPELGE